MWVRYVSTLTFVSYKTSQATGDHYIGQDRPEQANEKPSRCRNNQKRKQNKSVMQIGSLGPHVSVLALSRSTDSFLFACYFTNQKELVTTKLSLFS